MEPPANRRISWGLIVIAAVLSEVAVMIVLMIVILGHRFVIAPGHSASDDTGFDDAASYYVAPLSAGVAALFAAVWACRTATARFALHGLLVGLTAVLLTGGFIFFIEPKNRMMYGVSFLLRVIGGWPGGLIAQRTRDSSAQLRLVNQEFR